VICHGTIFIHPKENLMTQHQLDRAVARATGETVETIQHRGFSFCAARPVLPRTRHKPRFGRRRKTSRRK
jgi:hypothetical protein